MGLFSKKQMLAVIQWEDDSKDIMVYRYPLKEREVIMNGSTLIVRPSQMAVFVYKGQICDMFGPGSYKLATENIPIITKLLSLPTAFEITNKAEVYFVNTKQMLGIKWGTQNPIMMRDAEFGTVRLRAFGVYSFKVDNAKLFMEEVFGTNQVYKTADIANQIKPTLLQVFADSVAESKISALDLASNYREFSGIILNASQEEFNKLGLKLCSFVIENISLPKEVEEILDKRTSLGIMEPKMGTFMQYEAAEAMRDAAKNPGGIAGMGVGLGAGVGIGNVFAQAVSSAKNTPTVPVAENASAGTVKCAKCGAEIKKGAKFCPECGEKQPESKFCSHCGAKVGANAKFCPECGEKL